MNYLLFLTIDKKAKNAKEIRNAVTSGRAFEFDDFFETVSEFRPFKFMFEFLGARDSIENIRELIEVYEVNLFPRESADSYEWGVLAFEDDGRFRLVNPR